MLNVCTIMGRLGQNPEVRQTQSGKPVANFTIACERDFKNAEGQKETDWIRCACFGATADFVGRYIKKGRAVCVEGRLQIRKWTDRDGNAKETAEIVANNVYFADSPNRDNGQIQGSYPPQAAGYQPNYQGGGQYGDQPGYGGGYGNGYQNPGGGYGGRQN